MLRKNYAFFDKLSKTSQKDTLEQQEVENYMTVAFTELIEQPINTKTCYLGKIFLPTLFLSLFEYS